ncbi:MULTISPECIES: hypothetical protein [Actinoplanes]|uniref:hypothetical protein n=1 Tax=Actinoplanes TaxID=1865 RepID=UPI000B0C4E8B|nr:MULTISPECIES: hypothetical protein [Actinoplanes]
MRAGRAVSGPIRGQRRRQVWAAMRDGGSWSEAAVVRDGGFLAGPRSDEWCRVGGQ